MEYGVQRSSHSTHKNPVGGRLDPSPKSESVSDIEVENQIFGASVMVSANK